MGGKGVMGPEIGDSMYPLADMSGVLLMAGEEVALPFCLATWPEPSCLWMFSF
jgi:hypothetical protein